MSIDPTDLVRAHIGAVTLLSILLDQPPQAIFDLLAIPLPEGKLRQIAEPYRGAATTACRPIFHGASVWKREQGRTQQADEATDYVGA